MQFQPYPGLHGYVPRWLVGAARGEANPLRPRITPMRSAVVFADISGFSRLTRIYQDKGDASVEELSLIISDYLGRFIERIFAWGGDIENLYGDALLAFWPETEASFATAMKHALGCAADIVGLHDNYVSEGGIVLRVRAAVMAGDLFAVQAGGGADQWIFMLSGACLADIPPMLQLAQPGQICASPAIRAAMLQVPEVGTPRQLRELAGEEPSTVPRSPVPRADDDPFLRAFVASPIRRRDPLRPEWLAEFRWLAMLCVGIPGLRCGGPEDLAAIQDAVTTVQALVEQFEGVLIRVSMSDKGPMAMIAFGLPDQTHDDDAIRAVRAAQEIHAALADQGAADRWAVTFGLAYCGVVGNRERHVYTTMGDAVNRAAKLLDRQDLPAMVCDEAIMQMARHRIAFGPIVAGETNAAALFRPLAYSPSVPRTYTALIGRAAEIAWLRRHLSQLGTRSPQPVLYIDGEPGIGKSTLIAALSGMTEGRCALFRGAADPLAGTASPFAAWSPVFAAAFAAEVNSGPDRCEASLRAALERQGSPGDFVRLAGIVLPSLRTPDHRSVVLPPEDMARVTCEVLSALLRDRLCGEPGLIVIEDVHWMDSASWSLVGHVAREVLGVLVVLVARPDTEGLWSGMRELAATVPVERLRLEPLDRAAVTGVVADALTCAEVSPRLVDVIQERAAGNPLFARQLAFSLRDKGALILRDGLCRLAGRSSEAASLQLPESVQRTMVARFDRLPADLQLTLKAASVIGPSFSRRTLDTSLPVVAQDTRIHETAGMHESAGIGERLARLTVIGMVGITQAGADPVYSFDHALTQEAVYQLLPFEQRRRLHATVANFFEAEPPALRPPRPCSACTGPARTSPTARCRTGRRLVLLPCRAVPTGRLRWRCRRQSAQ